MQHVSPRTLWETALGQLELQVTRPNFDTWLRNTVGLRLEDDTLVVGVPSDFALEWLRTRVNAPIGHTVTRLFGKPVSIAFEVLGIRPPAEAERAASALPHLLSLKPDPRLTFDSFTVVDSNRLAYRAARQVASGTGKYSPLILYGAPGLGKTHLLHAIAHAAASTSKQIIFLTGEEFVNRYGEAVRKGQPHTFRDAYRQCDLFLLDDLQFLASRPGSQEQFFHTFNTLSSANRRIAVTCNVPPTALTGLSPHLLSRLQAGLLLEFPLPTAQERHHILLEKAAHLPTPLPAQVVHFIAEQPLDNIRQLEGTLNRISAFAELHPDPLTLEAAQAALFPFQPTRPTPDTILTVVCAHFHIDRNQLSGPSRARDITYARHIAMYLLRLKGQRPLTEIGAILGNRDHSTVLSGYRRIARERNSVPQTQADLRQLESSLTKRSLA